MKRLGSRAAISAALLLGCAGVAFAADYPLITKEYPVAAAAPKSNDPTACNSFQAFVVTDCQLIWAGVRFYGTIDVGGTYQTHGAPWDPFFVTGASYFMQKMNRTAGWSIAPNGMGQSALGIQVKEPLGLGWSLIGQLEGGFDPYSLEYANSPHSEFRDIGIPQKLWSTNGDSSRGGQFYNSLGFVGVSNDTYGTLTVLRQNALTLDGVLAYDPMGGAYAFSPIGFSGVVAGGGYTENAKYTTALKYRLNIANWRVAGLWQFGGYDQNNASEGAFEAQLGGDFKIGPGTLSLDAIWGFNKDGVALGLGGAPNNLQGIPNLFGPGSNAAIMTATISNNTNVMALAKYTWDKWRFFAGYEWNQFANPSDPFVGKGSGFTDIAGDFVCVACNNGISGTNINSTAFNASAGFKDRVLQVFGPDSDMTSPPPCMWPAPIITTIRMTLPRVLPTRPSAICPIPTRIGAREQWTQPPHWSIGSSYPSGTGISVHSTRSLTAAWSTATLFAATSPPHRACDFASDKPCGWRHATCKIARSCKSLF